MNCPHGFPMSPVCVECVAEAKQRPHLPTDPVLPTNGPQSWWYAADLGPAFGACPHGTANDSIAPCPACMMVVTARLAEVRTNCGNPRAENSASRFSKADVDERLAARAFAKDMRQQIACIARCEHAVVRTISSMAGLEWCKGCGAYRRVLEAEGDGVWELPLAAGMAMALDGRAQAMGADLAELA